MSISRVFLILAVMLGTIVALSTRYVNEDLFGALAAGRDICRGLLLAPDHWSFAAEGLPWVNQAWLSHLLLYASYEALGPSGPVLTKFILFASCLAIVLIRCRSLGASPEVSLIALLGGVLAVAPFVALRQENFGLCCLLLLSLFLTDQRLRGPVGNTGLLAVMALWSNLHGSFMLGIALVGTKAVLMTSRCLWPSRFKVEAGRSRRDAARWWLLTALSLAVAATLSPYGMDNILMPFRQLGTAAVTAHSADWLPLWRFQQIDEGFFSGGSKYPYLTFVILVIAGVSALIVKGRQSPGRIASAASCTSADWIMEAAIAVITMGLAVRFGRFALFSALSLVPAASVILQLLWNDRHFGHERPSCKKDGPSTLRDEAHETNSAAPPVTPVLDGQTSATAQGSGRHGTILRSGHARIAYLASSVMLCMAMGWLCFRVAVVPYLPGNPCRPERPVMRELMSFDSFSPALAAFMNRNRITERVLSGWSLSSYLMWSVPDIQLFMDTRDQSYYPAKVIRDFFVITGILPAPESASLELLDHYGVLAVAVTTSPVDFELAIRLMNSRKWACLFADPYSMLLVRADSSRFRDMIAPADLESLWYPDPGARVVSEATLSHFFLGRIRPELVDALKGQARVSPWPNYYTLICLGLDDPKKCFTGGTSDYLMSEARRLARINPIFSNGAEQITDSLTRICEILAENSLKCGDPLLASKYQNLAASSGARYQQIRRYYLGSLF